MKEYKKPNSQKKGQQTEGIDGKPVHVLDAPGMSKTSLPRLSVSGSGFVTSPVCSNQWSSLLQPPQRQATCSGLHRSHKS